MLTNTVNKCVRVVCLVQECRSNGWQARCEPTEMGCRGFAAQSLRRAYNMLGIKGTSRRRGIKSAMEAAEVASRWLWIRLWRAVGGVVRPGHKLGLDQPQLGHLGEGV